MWDGQPDSLFSRLAKILKDGEVSQEIEAMIASALDEGVAEELGGCCT